jgi:hypothetical protein
MVLNRRALERQRQAEEVTGSAPAASVDTEATQAIEPPVRMHVPALPTRHRLEGIVNAVVPQADVEGYVREICRLWHEARDKFLAIGEYLIHAKETLQHGEYERMIETRLPFQPAAALRIRTVAEAVRRERLRREEVPCSYNTAYELTLLAPDELEEAKSRNLVRPDVYLREIKAFRAELRESFGLDRHSALKRERARIVREMDRLRMRLAEIEEEIRSGSGERDMVIDGEGETMAAT